MGRLKFKIKNETLIELSELRGELMSEVDNEVALIHGQARAPHSKTREGGLRHAPSLTRQ